MPERTSRRQSCLEERQPPDQIANQVWNVEAGLTVLLREAEMARRLRAEAAPGDGAGAVCAWNHFENIPTFYNWNNRPR